MSQAELTVLIVDDERHARERLDRLVAEIPSALVVAQCGTGIEALRTVEEIQPAVVLLDIRMPGMSGIETARHLATFPAPPAVVFTTAYDEYAMEAFDAQAVGYLLKPVRKERLEQALRQASRLTAAQLDDVAEPDSEDSRRQHVAVRSRNELRLIPIKDVLYFRADQKYVCVHHVDGEDLIDGSLTELADEFAPDFARIHRSYLVAIGHLEALERDDAGRHFVRVRGQEELLPVGRRQVSDLKRLITSS